MIQLIRSGSSLRRHASAGSAVLIALMALPVDAAVLTVGPASDPDCHHHSLQAAINAAATSPGLDILRVTMGEYPGQRLIISDTADLAIEGGFVSCGLLVVAGTSTLDGQSASPAGPVIGHYGSSRLTLSRLVVRNGNATSDSAASGGGIDSFGAGALSLRDVLVHSNRARLGGGIAVTGPAPASKIVDLDGVGVNSNTAMLSGGGLYAVNAVVTIGGDGINYFAGNFAQGTLSNQGGGALFAANSDVFIHSLPPAQSPFMDSNFAQSYGGAAHFVNYGGGTRYLWLRNQDGLRPLVVANNAADRGGAFYLASNSSSTASYTAISASLTDSILENNDALDGGAFFLQASGNGPAALTAIGMAAAQGNQACPPQLRCNRISGSQSSNSGTVYALNVGATGSTRFRLERGHLLDNFSSGDGVIGGNGSFEADNSVIGNNSTGATGLVAAGLITIRNSTIAGNAVAGTQLMTVNSQQGPLTLQNSIVFQPGKTIYGAPATATTDLRNLLVGSGHGLANLALYNVQQTFDPLFVNPGIGDFRPQQGSQAINRYAPGNGVPMPTVDLVGASRPAPPTGSPTPYDFGAYEYGAVVDALFADGFDQN